jgi:16S rRNA (cytidine1402-2'-O)-methyltransferase
MRESTPHSNDPLPWKDHTLAIERQDWPVSALYVVATPIGNLADLGLRARYALQHCDLIAAEDTRATRVLLQAWGIDTPLMAAHRHNEAQAAQGIIERLAQGQRVALVSDAGAPGVSDPGARVVRAVRQAGFRVIPLPGPSAVIAALMASGATSDENPAFVFAGFVPPKAVARRRWIAQWCGLSVPVVMYESPHRLQACVADMLEVCGPERELTLARELTKRFEQIHTARLDQMLPWLAQDAHRCQGEFVLIVHEARAQENDTDALPAQALAMLDALLPLVSVRDAAKVVSKTLGLPRDKLYAAALQRGESA